MRYLHNALWKTISEPCHPLLRGTLTDSPVDTIRGVGGVVAFCAPSVKGWLGAGLVWVIVQRLAAHVLVPHRVARAAFGHKDRLVWQRGVARLELLPRLVAEPLDVDRERKQIVEREHVGQCRAAEHAHTHANANANASRGLEAGACRGSAAESDLTRVPGGGGGSQLGMLVARRAPGARAVCLAHSPGAVELLRHGLECGAALLVAAFAVSLIAEAPDDHRGICKCKDMPPTQITLHPHSTLCARARSRRLQLLVLLRSPAPTQQTA